MTLCSVHIRSESRRARINDGNTVRKHPMNVTMKNFSSGTFFRLSLPATSVHARLAGLAGLQH